MRSSPTGADYNVCVDAGCGMPCIDRVFLKKEFPSANVQAIAPIEILGLGNKIRQSREYAVIPIPSRAQKKEPPLAAITRECHLVDGLPCHMLIGNDIAESEGFLIDMLNK